MGATTAPMMEPMIWEAVSVKPVSVRCRAGNRVRGRTRYNRPCFVWREGQNRLTSHYDDDKPNFVLEG